MRILALGCQNMQGIVFYYLYLLVDVMIEEMRSVSTAQVVIKKTDLKLL